MGRMKLFGEPGWGSAIVEAQLAWYGFAYDFDRVGDLFKSAESRQRLATVNPLAQIPTLVLDDGTVMTESAAITLHLADVAGNDSLVPGAGHASRAAFLRWLMFIVANIYPTYTYADDPTRFVEVSDAQQSFKNAVDRYAQKLYAILDGEAGEPWFLGERFSRTRHLCLRDEPVAAEATLVCRACAAIVRHCVADGSRRPAPGSLAKELSGRLARRAPPSARRVPAGRRRHRFNELALGQRQQRIPQIEDQHDAQLVAVVARFVLDRVVEDRAPRRLASGAPRNRRDTSSRPERSAASARRRARSSRRCAAECASSAPAPRTSRWGTARRCRRAAARRARAPSRGSARGSPATGLAAAPKVQRAPAQRVIELAPLVHGLLRRRYWM